MYINVKAAAAAGFADTTEEKANSCFMSALTSHIKMLCRHFSFYLFSERSAVCSHNGLHGNEGELPQLVLLHRRL